MADIKSGIRKKLIHRVNRKKVGKQLVKAMSITVATIFLAFSLLNPKAVVNAAKNIMEWFETYISFRFSESIKTQKIHRYTMGYVPNGYVEVINEYHDGVFGMIVYEGEGKEPLSLEYGISDGRINIDNEGVELEILEDEGLIIYYFHGVSQKENIATWLSEDETIVFTLVGEQSKGLSGNKISSQYIVYIGMKFSFPDSPFFLTIFFL